MMPLSDHHPTRSFPAVTWAIIATCVTVYLLQETAGSTPASFQEIIYQYGFLPALTLGGFTDNPDTPTHNLGWLAMLSSMFMHGSWMHLGGNMLYLHIFGDNLEDRLGKLKFLVFYLLSGAAAALAQAITNPASFIPMVGASGAISGVLGGYLVLYPRQTITVYMPYVGLTQMPALYVLGSWFAYQVIYGLAAATQEGGGVAFWAHVGGFAAGFLLLRLFAPRQKPQLWT